MDRMSIEFPMRQATGWSPVYSMHSQANLLGGGLTKQGASLARYGFRGVSAPFRPEGIAQPDQRYSHRHSRKPLDIVRKQRRQRGQHGRNGEQNSRPARQDASPEGRNAKQQAAKHIRYSY